MDYFVTVNRIGNTFPHSVGENRFAPPDSEHFDSLPVCFIRLDISFLMYSQRPDRDPLETRLGFLYPILKNKYYFDVVYGWYVDTVQQTFAVMLSWFEKTFIIRYGVHAATGASKAAGKVLRLLQSGLVQFYALVFVLGVVYLFFIMVINL